MAFFGLLAGILAAIWPALPVRATTSERVVTNRYSGLAIEGFDPETLPENPLAAMFKALDPSLVSSTRVNPEHEAGKMLDWLANGMAKQVKPEVPESYQESAERIGYRIIFGKDAAAEPEPEGMEP